MKKNVDYSVHDRKYQEARANGWDGWGGASAILRSLWFQTLLTVADFAGCCYKKTQIEPLSMCTDYEVPVNIHSCECCVIHGRQQWGGLLIGSCL